ncbi:MAG: DMT family transporter [Paracoccaceae bacterium]
MTATPRAAPIWRVALWMTGAIAAFTVMAVAGREAGANLDTFEIMMWRSLIGLATVGTVALATGGLGQVRTDRLPLHTLRNAAHFTGQNLWLYAVITTPLATVFAIEFTSPIWALLLAPLFLAERITARALGCAALGFVGILLVARPGAQPLTPGMAAALGAAVAFALTALFTRRLTRDQPLLTILFWLAAMQAAMGAFGTFWDGDVTWPTARDWPWVIAVGYAGLAAHTCLTTALSLAPASTVMPIDFARLPVIVVVGALVYGEAVSPWVLAGGAVILAANWLNLSSTRSGR